METPGLGPEGGNSPRGSLFLTAITAFPPGHEPAPRRAPPQFVGAKARARPRERSGGVVEPFAAPDARYRRPFGARRRAQPVDGVETDRVAVRAEIFDQLSARQPVINWARGHCNSPVHKS